MARLMSKKNEADRPEPLQDFAARTLTRAILTGELRPGEKLSPTKLAEDLGVSHIPVREALSALEAAGHVVRQPRVGFFVAELTLDYIEDVYHWREVLENEAHRLAVPLLDDNDLARMRRVNAAARRTTSISGRYLDLNREFHFIAFERAGSATLLRFLNHLWDASLRYQNALSSVSGPHKHLTDQHESLVEAFEARDVKLVNARMALHRSGTLVAMRELVSAHERAVGS
jgi:DNA-binding GntR family transcriptional regulator